VTSRRQIIANRRNAQKSTGPRTTAGKLRSRRNALRHGLTAETVIAVFESAADYCAFERRILNQYRPRSPIEQQLLLQLSSLLWRLKRTTAIETGLFHIQGQIIRERKSERDLHERVPTSARVTSLEIFRLKPDSAPVQAHGHALPQELAQCFMRVARLDDEILEKLHRYEAALWRRIAQIVNALPSRRQAR
jgi:hypothetical protein